MYISIDTCLIPPEEKWYGMIITKMGVVGRKSWYTDQKIDMTNLRETAI